MEKFHPVHSVYDGLFNTASGIKVNIHNPDVSTIYIDDIASALSKICRFGGNINQFYTVAQHSLLVAALAPKELKLEALLHDASEAYIGDVIKPLKVVLGNAYSVIEDRFMDTISERFGLDQEKLKAIKQYDKEALELEHAYLQKGEVAEWKQKMLELGLWQLPLFDHAFVRRVFLKEFDKQYTLRHNSAQSTG